MLTARRALFRRVAPRLEQAHRERQLELRAESRARVAAAQAVLKAERLVAHRELQLIRAGVRPGGRRKRTSYVDVRTSKLDAAHAELARAQRRAERLGVSVRGPEHHAR